MPARSVADIYAMGESTVWLMCRSTATLHAAGGSSCAIGQVIDQRA
jgi:hypothetical protein